MINLQTPCSSPWLPNSSPGLGTYSFCGAKSFSSFTSQFKCHYWGGGGGRWGRKTHPILVHWPFSRNVHTNQTGEDSDAIAAWCKTPSKGKLLLPENRQELTEEQISLPPCERDLRSSSSGSPITRPKLSCNREILPDYGSPKGSKSEVSHHISI